jgi:hypothetical protein
MGNEPVAQPDPAKAEAERQALVAFCEREGYDLSPSGQILPPPGE